MRDIRFLSIIIIYTIISAQVFAQNLGIGPDTFDPDASAGVEMRFTNKGLLIPRVTLTSTSSPSPITSPANSLLIYNTVTTDDVTPGYYYWTGSKWMRLLAIDDKPAWLLSGNAGTTPGTNFIGTTDNVGLSFKTNNKENMRLYSTGQLVISDADPIPSAESNTILTVKPTTNTYRNAISIPMSGASSTAYAINVSSATYNSRGYFYENTSTSTSNVFYGAGAQLSTTNIVSGYLGYRNSSGLSYGIYGINGTNGTYTTNANAWAAFIQGRAVISSESSPTSPLGVDLEIRNTTTGTGNPATLSMRQTTQESVSGKILARLNFGDNYTTDPQAQIQVLRDAAASSASDMPTAITFSTTTDGTSTLNERMRITNSGNVGIGTTSPAAKLHVAGNIKTNTINETSDARFKKNIQNIDTPLSKVLSLRGVYYYWDLDNPDVQEIDSSKQIGMIAQEVEKILPELVNTDSNGYKSVEYSRVVAVLVEAMKEQQKTIDEQKDMINNLNERITKLEELIKVK